MKSTGGKLMSRRANWEHTWLLGLGVQTYGGFLKRPVLIHITFFPLQNTVILFKGKHFPEFFSIIRNFALTQSNQRDMSNARQLKSLTEILKY